MVMWATTVTTLRIRRICLPSDMRLGPRPGAHDDCDKYHKRWILKLTILMAMNSDESQSSLIEDPIDNESLVP